MVGSAVLVAGLVLSGCGSGAAIAVSPAADGPIDVPVHLTVTGQDPGSIVTVSGRARFLGEQFTSSARYRADRSGTVDLDRDAPLAGGSYTGVDGMGLFWSMAAVRGSPPAAYADAGAPEDVTISVAGARPATLHLVRRMDPGPVTSRRLRPGGPAGGLYADYLAPVEGGDRAPGVVIIGGSEGGLSTGLPVAEVLASHGVAALDLAYFAEPGLPAQLSGIPIEYFAAALRWLGRQPGVDAHRLFVYGVSRGTEAALLTASHFPSLVHGVVAMMPTNSAFCAVPNCRTAAWTYNGRPVPYTRQVSDPYPTDTPGAVIPIGRFGGPVLLACAGRDTRWDSCAYARAISSEVEAAGHPLPELLDYPDAGHGAGFPLAYLPGLESPGLAGATPSANPDARAAEWPLILSFLHGAGGGAPAAGRADPAEYRSVVLDGRVAACARVFRTAAERSQGLSGPHPPAAGAFVHTPAQPVSMWMHDTHRDLVAVWVGSDSTVLGSVTMRAMSAVLHPAPAPVPLILELPPSLWRRWAPAQTAALGGACSA